MALGNKGFADLITGGSDAERAARRPPRTGILGARENRLADLATGTMVTRVHEFVDPASCRIWDGHNRDYAALDETSCADLIESLRAQGRQEVPAIVRRVSGDPKHEYEVICGARRHWTVAWLRANNYPEFKFLIEPRELTDEEAFRLADLENRSRKDLSDYERAIDYARAIDRYYGGSQQKMVERLEVSKSWLSRYLELARLPPEVIAGFGSPHVIGISHAAVLAPLLRHPHSRAQVLQAAAAMAEVQARRAGEGEAPLPPATVLRRLSRPEAAEPAERPAKGAIVIRAADGSIIASGQRSRDGSIGITIPATPVHPRARLLDAVGRILDQAGR
jgi:ParB family chromosome partitioning protein